MMKDLNRFTSNRPVTCEHCGYMEDWFILYEDGCDYCTACAYANGAIDDDQWREDHMENEELALTYHEGKVEYYREKVKNG